MNTQSAACPDLGTWRAWLDREEHAADLDLHIEACPACRRAVDELRADATAAAGALAALGPVSLPTASETAVARERLQRARSRFRFGAPVPEPHSIPLRSRVSAPWRIAASGIAAAVVLSVVVAFTPQGQTAAAAFLAQFRSRQVVAVEVSPQSQADIERTLESLSDLGTFQSSAPSGRRPVPGGPRMAQPRQATLAEATQHLGFAVQTPDPNSLPAGVERTPQVQLVPANEIKFTFDKAKALRHMQANGHANVQVPDKFNGASLVISTPAAAVLMYSGTQTHQTVMIGQSGEVVIDTQGQVTLDEMRDFLLALPGLPRETTQQLRLIRNWRETLAIPIPTDRINWQAATFKGHPGLLLNDNTGVGSAAVWHADGQLFGVFGTMKATDLKRVADSLAAR